jgi:hypothetical protein
MNIFHMLAVSIDAMDLILCSSFYRGAYWVIVNLPYGGEHYT